MTYQSPKKKIKKLLSENTIDAEGLADELELMALNNYPTEYKNRDLNGLIAKLVKDIKSQSARELDEEIRDIIANIRSVVQKQFRAK